MAVNICVILQCRCDEILVPPVVSGDSIAVTEHNLEGKIVLKCTVFIGHDE